MSGTVKDRVKVYVANGHTVIGDVVRPGIQPTPYGPGSMVELSPDDAARLTALGFVQAEPPATAPVPTSGNNPVTVTGSNGFP